MRTPFKPYAFPLVALALPVLAACPVDGALPRSSAASTVAPSDDDTPATSAGGDPQIAGSDPMWRNAAR